MKGGSVIVVLDEDERNVGIVKETFAEYTVLSAKSEESAFGLLKDLKETVSLFLVSLLLPMEGGFNLLRSLSLGEKYGDTPIIALYGEDLERAAKALDLGASEVMPLPMHPAILKCRAKNVLKNREDRWQHYEDEAYAKEFLEMQSAHEIDALTGLYTREAFFHRAVPLFSGSPPGAFTLIYLDIGDFRIFSENFPRTTGELMLKTVACNLSADPTWLSCHLERDHFLVCVPTKGFDPQIFLKHLQEGVGFLGLNYRISFYAGIYSVNNSFQNPEEMIECARMALMEGRKKDNSFQYYDETMGERHQLEQTILRDMALGLAAKQFVIHLQPIYSLEKTDTPVEAEALVRWLHPSLGMLKPSDFVPVLEKKGFMDKLDRYIWREVCGILSKMREKTGRLLPISVNISKSNFYDLDFLEYMQNLVEEYKLKPELLKLEITESAYLENPKQVAVMVEGFRKRGFPVLLDDFGSGYSSINMLGALDVSAIKIDVGFMQSLTTSKKTMAILKSVASLSGDLSLDIIVEGVEDTKQVEILKEFGVAKAQGYYFSKPMPQEEFLGRLSG